MKTGRTIFIGDVHGCYEEFKLLLKKIKLTKNDKVYLTGDVIAKGPKSFKILKFLYKNSEQFKSVKGNYELEFLDFLNGKKILDNKKDFKNLKKKLIEKSEIIDFLKKIPLYIQNSNFILVHGGIIPGKNLDEHSELEISTLRYYNGKPWYKYYKGSKKIIYGHWGTEGIKIRKNTVGLDSGCVYGKWLTAYILETGEIIQQGALDIYINIFKGNGNGNTKEI